MKKNLPIIISSVVIAVLAITLIVVLFVVNKQPEPYRGVEPVVNVSPMEPDSSIWGQNFPNQYSTFLKTKENNTKTEFGGSVGQSKLEEDPRLVTLFAGYPFSIEYNDERGHEWALTDVRETQRVNEKTAGTCYSCKSSNNPQLWTDMGMAEYDRTLFPELGKQIEFTIGCANCHEATTMRLIVTNPALKEALEAQGKDWTTFSRQEMRLVVCANCHVEYYMVGDGKYLTFPWEKGTRIEKISEYYQEQGFKDWEHPQSGAPMIKMQHPEFEVFTAGSTHFKAGVACADCHMPYLRDGAAKYSNHNIQSPLVNPEAACGQCHTDVQYVVDRVSIIQNSTREAMDHAEDALVAAITAIEKAKASANVNGELLVEAQNLHREAQLRWDFIAAENSMGFHNPTEALRILTIATDLARQAELKAYLAAPDIMASGNQP
jgi:nitrite reductase (cytochrome c-552)